MNSYITFAIGVVVGAVLVRMVMGRKWQSSALVEKQAEEKAEHEQKILAYLETTKGKQVTNNEIQDLLDISDATATRYLEELEKEGVIRQVGETGRSVFYEKN